MGTHVILSNMKLYNHVKILLEIMLLALKWGSQSS